MFNRLFFSRNIVVYLLAMGLTTLLGACGGGEDDGPVYPNINYTGVQTRAVIDQTNAADFPFVMLESSNSSGNIPLAASVEPQTTESIPDVENIGRTSGLISGLIKNNLANSVNQVTGATQTINGSCGGSVTINENVTSTSFSGSMEFANLCEFDAIGELTLYGLITYNGDYYLDTTNTPILTSLNLTINYLKMTFTDNLDNSISQEFSGSLVVTSFDPNTNEPLDFTITVNYVYEGKVYKVANLVIDEFGGIISGTLYHPDHGYVIVTTDPLDAFDYNPITEQFCNGTLLITGADLSGNVAAIHFTDPDSNCTVYNICVDINGSVQCSDFNPWGAAPVNPWYTPTAAIPVPPPAPAS